jgi:hypothetical protein
MALLFSALTEELGPRLLRYGRRAGFGGGAGGGAVKHPPAHFLRRGCFCLAKAPC